MPTLISSTIAAIASSAFHHNRVRLPITVG